MKQKAGFSLIETIIVISLISSLSFFGLSIFHSSHQKARDTLRKTDLDTVKKAADLARLDCKNKAYYPVGENDDLNPSKNFDKLNKYLEKNKYISKEIENKEDSQYPYEYYSPIIENDVCPAQQGNPKEGAHQGIKPNFFLLRVKLERGTLDKQAVESKSRCQTQINFMTRRILELIKPSDVDGYYYQCGN